MTKYFLLTQMKHSDENNSLLYVMTWKTFSIYFLLLFIFLFITKNGLANLWKLKKIKKEKKIFH